jgi:uncharacterized membrane protein
MTRTVRTSYNDIAGGSVERLAALSDCLFSFAMTVLVLDLKVPENISIHTDRALATALHALAPRFIVCAMSFITLGIFWTGQQTHLTQLSRGDRDFGWIQLGFLFAVALVPFTTLLLAEFIELRLALVIYWLNILALGATLYAGWAYAARAKFLKPDVSQALSTAIERRVIIAQSMYAFGALLCLFSTYLSIGFIIIVQLYYAIAPGIPRDWRREHRR